VEFIAFIRRQRAAQYGQRTKSESLFKELFSSQQATAADMPLSTPILPSHDGVTFCGPAGQWYKNIKVAFLASKPVQEYGIQCFLISCASKNDMLAAKLRDSVRWQFPFVTVLIQENVGQVKRLYQVTTPR
jgi:hypothetical protein